MYGVDSVQCGTKLIFKLLNLCASESISFGETLHRKSLTLVTESDVLPLPGEDR